MKRCVCFFLGVLCLHLLAVESDAANRHAFSVDAFIGDRWERISVLSGDDVFVGGTVMLNIAFPQRLHTQFDLSGRKFTEDGTLGKAGVHLFHQTSQHLWGIFYTHSEFEGFTGDQIALEVEHYDDQMLTIRGMIGYEFKNWTEDLRFGGLFLQLYPTSRKNFMIETGLSHVDETSAEFKITEIEVLNLRMEVLLERLNTSIFFEKDWRSDDNFSLIGIRYYFGKHKPLIFRHREDGIFNGR